MVKHEDKRTGTLQIKIISARTNRCPYIHVHSISSMKLHELLVDKAGLLLKDARCNLLHHVVLTDLAESLSQEAHSIRKASSNGHRIPR